MRETIVKINKAKSLFFEKIQLTVFNQTHQEKKKERKPKLVKIRNERGEITTNTTEIQKILRGYCE